MDDGDNPFGIIFSQNRGAYVVKVTDSSPSTLSSKAFSLKEILSFAKITKVSGQGLSILPSDILIAINKIDIIGSATFEGILFRKSYLCNKCAVIFTVNKRLLSMESPVLLRFRRNLVRQSTILETEPPDICLHLSGLDGENLELTIHSMEDKFTAISSFIQNHGLPEELIPKLMEKLTSPSSDASQKHNLVPQEDNYRSFDDSDLTLRAEYSYSSLKFGRSSSSPLRPIKRSLSLSSLPSMKLSFSPRKLRNQSFFDDMHEEAARSRERKELLRELEWNNREAEVLATSFRYMKLDCDDCCFTYCLENLKF